MTGTHSTPATGAVAGAGVRAEAGAIRAAGVTAGMSGMRLTGAKVQEETTGVVSGERRGSCPGLITRGEETMTLVARASQEGGMGIPRADGMMRGVPNSLTGTSTSSRPMLATQ